MTGWKQVLLGSRLSVPPAMTNRIASDIVLGLLALLAGAVFMSVGEDAVAVTLDVLGVICLAGSLDRLSAG